MSLIHTNSHADADAHTHTLRGSQRMTLQITFLFIDCMVFFNDSVCGLHVCLLEVKPLQCKLIEHRGEL